MKQQNASIIDSIAQEETRLARLDAERTEILERLGELRKQLSVIEVEPATTPELSSLGSNRRNCSMSIEIGLGLS